MKIMNKFILFISFSFLLSCTLTNNKQEKNSITTEPSNFDERIKLAEQIITKHLKRNRIRTKDVTYIYDVIGFYNDYKTPCDIFQKVNPISEINNFKFASSWVTAMVLNSKNDYFVKSSSLSLWKKPNELNSYRLDMEMIKLAKDNGYTSYIKFFNCDIDLMFAYDGKKLDVYKISNDTIKKID
jgi:hypothetical protein